MISLAPGATTTTSNASSTTAATEGAAPVRTSGGDVVVPKKLQEGELMLKISAKKAVHRKFYIDGDKGTIEWESSKKAGLGGLLVCLLSLYCSLTNSLL